MCTYYPPFGTPTRIPQPGYSFLSRDACFAVAPTFATKQNVARWCNKILSTTIIHCNTLPYLRLSYALLERGRCRLQPLRLRRLCRRRVGGAAAHGKRRSCCSATLPIDNTKHPASINNGRKWATKVTATTKVTTSTQNRVRFLCGELRPAGGGRYCSTCLTPRWQIGDTIWCVV